MTKQNVCWFLSFFLILKGRGGCVLKCCRPVVPDVFTSASASLFVEMPGIYQHCNVSRLKFRTLQTFTIPPPQCSQLAVFSVTGAGAVTVGVLRPHQWPCYWPHWSAWSVCLWPLERISTLRRACPVSALALSEPKAAALAPEIKLTGC